MASEAWLKALFRNFDAPLVGGSGFQYVPSPDAGHAYHDATSRAAGLKVFGAGEWHQEKHGLRKRRMYRKLHLLINADTDALIRQEDDPNGAWAPRNANVQAINDLGLERTETIGKASPKTPCRYRVRLHRKPYQADRRAIMQHHGMPL